MEITRETVLKWLDTERRSQSWLAEQCGVTDQAVSNWLRSNKSRTISASAQITIRRLIEEDTAKKTSLPPAIPQNLILYPTREQFNLWNSAYKHSESETLEEWATEGLDRMAKAANYSHSWPKVAEDTPKYGEAPKVLPPPEAEDDDKSADGSK